jgi:hypothetical protein
LTHHPYSTILAHMAKIKYGLEWPDEMEDWQIHLKLYQRPELSPSPTPDWQHLIWAAQILWGKNNKHAQFIWHPWAVSIAREHCRHQELGLCGPGSCGKTEVMAILAILNWLVDPVHTLIYVTSTTIPRAKQKIWGAIDKYYNALPEHIKVLGTLRDNPTPTIWTEDGDRRIPTAGIHLVAFAQSSARDALNKIQGSKANSSPGRLDSRCMLVADELSDLSHAILAAIANIQGHPWFRCLAASNPRNKYDPFSQFVEPKAGWDSISVETPSWETKRGGFCLHFDDMKNPNWLAKENKWPIKRWEEVEDALNTMDLNSPEFWRNFRGFWSPLGGDQTIFTDDDIKVPKADQRYPLQDFAKNRPKIRAIGVDSAYSTGGDSTVAVIGDLGFSEKDYTPIVDIVGVEELTIDAHNHTQTASHQIGTKVLDVIQRYGVAIPDLGFDSTQITAADALAAVLKTNDFFRVSFAGTATKAPVSALDSTPADEKYTNRMTELWFFAKELLRHAQLFGITDEIANQLIARKYTLANGGRVTAEEKKEMKKRTGGRSPDHADAMCILLDVFRHRHGLRASGIKHIQNKTQAGSAAWLEFVLKTKSAHQSYRLPSQQGYAPRKTKPDPFRLFR